MSDALVVYNTQLSSRLFIGTAQYPSPAVFETAARDSRASVVTVSLRRESGGGRAGESFWSLIRGLGLRVLPNTAGCRSAREAIATAVAIARGVRPAHAAADAEVPRPIVGGAYRGFADESPVRAAQAARVDEVARVEAVRRQRSVTQTMIWVLVVIGVGVAFAAAIASR